MYPSRGLFILTTLFLSTFSFHAPKLTAQDANLEQAATSEALSSKNELNNQQYSGCETTYDPQMPPDFDSTYYFYTYPDEEEQDMNRDADNSDDPS